MPVAISKTEFGPPRPPSTSAAAPPMGHRSRHPPQPLRPLAHHLRLISFAVLGPRHSIGEESSWLNESSNRPSALHLEIISTKSPSAVSEPLVGGSKPPQYAATWALTHDTGNAQLKTPASLPTSYERVWIDCREQDGERAIEDMNMLFSLCELEIQHSSPFLPLPRNTKNTKFPSIISDDLVVPVALSSPSLQLAAS
ncbi:hypothetical protein BU16DRAFT_535523 [Lophium mytilinum]|uniref:Uncharacterized protein n=1 Tax=Lophium mytilinum TaxID=390894 RepID=A0A6A6R2X4_9PEZI|nr:hypothetical protein BU16DRAFT_535523 [Lophium mytilinum]